MSVENTLKTYLSYIPDLRSSKNISKNKIWAGQVREFLNKLNLSGTDIYQMNDVLSKIENNAYDGNYYESAEIFLRLLLHKGLVIKQSPISSTETPRPTLARADISEIIPRIIKAREPIRAEVVPIKPEVAPVQAEVFPIVELSPIKPIPKPIAPQITKSNKIFIVHGHDDTSRLELARMIEKMGLEAIILHEKPNEGKTIIEKFETHSKDVNFAFVLLTPDDLGGKDKGKLNKRARQNVILELGFFMGKLGRSRVCCLHKSEVEVPTDYSGVTFLPFKESVKECHEDIIRELKTAGYNLKF